MKKILAITAMVMGLSVPITMHAQDSTKTEKGVKKVAKDVGHKTAEVASKGKSEVTDSKYKDKVGPDNQKIYIDNHSKYYWVDDKGKKHYVKESELKDKPKD